MTFFFSNILAVLILYQNFYFHLSPTSKNKTNPQIISLTANDSRIWSLKSFRDPGGGSKDTLVLFRFEGPLWGISFTPTLISNLRDVLTALRFLGFGCFSHTLLNDPHLWRITQQIKRLEVCLFKTKVTNIFINSSASVRAK